MRLKLLFQHWLQDVYSFAYYRRYSHRCVLYIPFALMFGFVVYALLSMFYGDVFFSQENHHIDLWCQRENLPFHLSLMDPEEITLIISVFSLSSHQSGHSFKGYNDNLYKIKQAMWPFGRIANPVVAYFDNSDLAKYFEQIRSCFSPEKTKIVIVRRSELWSFQIMPAIDIIHQEMGSQKTVYTESQCASHAKYEVLERTVKDNPFGTHFFAWISADYFEGLDKTNVEIFKLIPPKTFSEEMVAMTQLFPHDPHVSATEVIDRKLVWVSGKMLLGMRNSSLKFTAHYKQSVESLVKDGISGEDEQIIYLMYSTSKRHQKQVKIKTYMCHKGQLNLHDSKSRELCLGYVCRNTWNQIPPPVPRQQNDS